MIEKNQHAAYDRWIWTHQMI